VDALPSQPDDANVGEYMSRLEEEIEALDDQLWEHPLMVAAHWVSDETGLPWEEIIDTAARHSASPYALSPRTKRVRRDKVEVLGKQFAEDTWLIEVVPYAEEVTAEELKDLRHVPPRLREVNHGELDRHVCELYPWIRALGGYNPPDEQQKKIEDPALRRIEDSINSKLDAVLQAKDALIALGGELSPLEYRIVKHLWDRGSDTVDSIGKNCWNEPVAKDSEIRAIKRLRERLDDLNKGIFVATKNEVVTLERPDK